MEPVIQLFTADEFRVRTITIDGTSWFVSSDACRALDLADMRQAVSRLDEDEKTLIPIATQGGQQRVSVISESGLYALIQTSRKPDAKRFRRWINHEVLPSIRKTGSYSIQPQLEAPQHYIPADYADALQLAADQARKLKAQASQIESQAKQIEAAQPAVEFVDRYVAAKTTQSLRAVAKILGMPEQAFIARLESDKILYRLSGRLMPAADQMQRGHFEVKTGEVNGIAYAQPKVTPRGVEYLARCVTRWQRQQARAEA